ncbi:hypothetical protein MHBO_003099, partial [Bonamia ostreae]
TWFQQQVYFSKRVFFSSTVGSEDYGCDTGAIVRCNLLGSTPSKPCCLWHPLFSSLFLKTHSISISACWDFFNFPLNDTQSTFLIFLLKVL